jgi:hypothetical protein
MTIRIEQTLHGYENGHQLLMSSTPLTNDAKQILLEQSDLSGSNIDEHFKNYLTGYPLGNYYAFSRTWYADEMPRPGCVWTQTLLISFSDLGKIPDLQQLREFFTRPSKDNYIDYGQSLSIEQSDLENSKKAFDESLIETALLKAIYEKPEKTIYLPALNSLEAEDAVLQLWSGQWPRLRRNFLFCTGALSIKLLDRREFDLQVVPKRNLISIELQAKNGEFIDVNQPATSDWIGLMYTAPKNQLRRFLWIFGSDISGLRSNFKPLVQLYGESLKRRPDIHFVNQVISQAFNNHKEGFRLKNKVILDNNLFHFGKKEILSYLLSPGNELQENFPPEELGERLITAYQDGDINLNEFTDFYNTASDKIPPDVWAKIAIDSYDLLAIITQDSRLLHLFKDRVLQLARLKQTWQSSNELQHLVLELLENNNQANWEEILQTILSSNSDIIYTVLGNDNRRVKLLLKWLNAVGYDLPRELDNRIFQKYKAIFIEYLQTNFNVLSNQTCNKIFQNLNVAEINAIGFDAGKWLSIYRRLSDEPTKIFASCVLLSFGFNRKVGNPAGLVVGCFADVYQFAKASKITGNDWGILPVDMSEEDDDPHFIANLFSYLNMFSPRKNDIPTWDYCELLLRTLVNKFIKFSWPRQAFLECLNTTELNQNFIRYALSFKKGEKFLGEIVLDINRRKIRPGINQTMLFQNIGTRN